MYSNSGAFTKDKLGLQLRNNRICCLVINYLIFAPPSLVVEVKFKLNNRIILPVQNS